MSIKIRTKSYDFTEHEIGELFGIFGFHNNIMAMQVLHNLYESNNLQYIVIDRYGNYRNLVRADDTMFFRIGVDMSLNMFSTNDNHEEHIITLAEIFQHTLNLDNEQISILIETLLKLYSGKNDVSLSLLINGLKAYESLASPHEATKISSLIRLLYPLYLGKGTLAFDRGCKYLLNNLKNTSKPMILDLSYLNNIEAKNLASLIILKFYLSSTEKSLILFDSINEILPSESYGSSNLFRQALFALSVIDQLVKRGIIIGVTASSTAEVNRRLITKLSTLIIAKDAIPQYLDTMHKKNSLLRKNDWLLISKDWSEPIIISLDPSSWILSDVDDDELLQRMKNLGYELESNIMINRFSVSTTLETIFKNKSEAVADLLEHASSMLITRSEAINILKRHEIEVEECETIIDEMTIHNLLRELLVSGRRLLHITHQGSIILNEYKLKRGET